MNGEIKEMLNITANVTWKFVDDGVYNSLKSDLMKSVTHKGKIKSDISIQSMFILVETILNTSDIKVIVYNGVLDYLVNTAGKYKYL